MQEFIVSHLIGSQPLLAPVAPGYLGCLCIQVEVGDKISQLMALSALEPRLQSAVRHWLASHPGATPEGFMAALDQGSVSAVDMGLYALSEEEDVIEAGHQLAKVLRLKPVVAAALGLVK